MTTVNYTITLQNSGRAWVNKHNAIEAFSVLCQVSLEDAQTWLHDAMAGYLDGNLTIENNNDDSMDYAFRGHQICWGITVLSMCGFEIYDVA